MKSSSATTITITLHFTKEEAEDYREEVRLLEINGHLKRLNGNPLTYVSKSADLIAGYLD